MAAASDARSGSRRTPTGGGGAAADVGPLSAEDVQTSVARIVDYLRRTRTPATRAEVKDKLGLDVRNNALFKALQENPKISVNREQKTMQYQPTVKGVESREQLLRHLQNLAPGSEGLPRLEDAYPEVAADLDALEAERKIIRIVNRDTKEVRIFARVGELFPRADDDVVTEWRKIAVPNAEALDRLLRETGHSVVDTHRDQLRRREPVAAPRRQAGPRRGATRPRALTNKHLQNTELFKELEDL
jgi:hypothetical protein